MVTGCHPLKNAHVVVRGGGVPATPWPYVVQPALRNSHAADPARRRVSPHFHRQKATTASGTSTTPHHASDHAAGVPSPSAAASTALSAGGEGAPGATGDAAATPPPLGDASAAGGVGPSTSPSAASARRGSPPRVRRFSRGGVGAAEKPVPSHTSSGGGAFGSTSKPPNGAAATSAEDAGDASLGRAPGRPPRRRRTDIEKSTVVAGGEGDPGWSKKGSPGLVGEGE